MANILVLGAGVMGSAFAQLLADAGNDVSLVGTHLDQEIIDSIKHDGLHPNLKVKLPGSINAFSYEELDQVMAGRIQLIVFGVNSAGVEWAVNRIGSRLKKTLPVLMLTKGLAAQSDSIEILPHVVQKGLFRFNLADIPVAAVGGPCIAGELAARRESSVVIAHPQSQVLSRLLALVDTSYYHARPSTDLIGVEVCAALKNFYTLAIGYAAGQLEKKGKAANGALMHNLAAGLFTQAMAEMSYFVDFFGGQPASVLGLAGAGDLYVTCQAGRNGRMGTLLGKGLRYKEAKSNHMPNDTVEGAQLAIAIGPTLKRWLADRKIDGLSIPLAIKIVEAVCDNLPLQIPWNLFYRDT